MTAPGRGEVDSGLDLVDTPIAKAMFLQMQGDIPEGCRFRIRSTKM